MIPVTSKISVKPSTDLKDPAILVLITFNTLSVGSQGSVPALM